MVKVGISWYISLKSKNGCQIRIQEVEKLTKMTFSGKKIFRKFWPKNSITASDNRPKFVYKITSFKWLKISRGFAMWDGSKWMQRTLSFPVPSAWWSHLTMPSTSIIENVRNMCCCSWGSNSRSDNSIRIFALRAIAGNCRSEATKSVAVSEPVRKIT